MTVGTRNLRGLRPVALELHPDLLPGVHPARGQGPSHGADGIPAGGEDDSRGRPSRTGLPVSLPFEFPIRRNLEKSMSGWVPVCPPTGTPSRPRSCDRAHQSHARGEAHALILVRSRGVHAFTGLIARPPGHVLGQQPPALAPRVDTCFRHRLIPRRTTSTGTPPKQRSHVSVPRRLIVVDGLGLHECSPAGSGGGDYEGH